MSTETGQPSTCYWDEGNIGAKLAMDDLLALISREAKLTPREEADTKSNEQTSARQSEIQQKPVGDPTEASFEADRDTVAAVTTSRKKTMFDGTGTIVGIDLAGLSRNQMKKQLPSGWCMQCLACHPYQDEVGSCHIRPLHVNVAMHIAIRKGDLPPVNPWQTIAETSKAAPQPAPTQPQEPEVTVANFEMTEEEQKMIKEVGDSKERLDLVLEHMDRKDDAIAQRRNEMAHLAQPSRPYASNTTTAGAFNSTSSTLQPTGPPSKKRKHRASRDGQQSGYANARSKRR